MGGATESVPAFRGLWLQVESACTGVLAPRGRTGGGVQLSGERPVGGGGGAMGRGAVGTVRTHKKPGSAGSEPCR